jgi:hypothetical protein
MLLYYLVEFFILFLLFFSITILFNITNFDFYNVIVFFDANQLVAQQSVGNFSTWIRANISIDPFIWHYFAVVQSSTEMFIYINDTLVIRMNSDNLIYSNRMETNLISKSFGKTADIYLDEIKIFDRALE